MDDFTIEDELDIHSALARYCHRCDDGDPDGVARLFAPDGVFAVPYRDLEARGRTAIAEFFHTNQGRPEQRGKHLTTNTVIEYENGRVTLVSDFLFLQPAGAKPTPAMSGRYNDEFVKIDGKWLFTRRNVMSGA
jgi:uncharacterized protein (TIGR02246 family)